MKIAVVGAGLAGLSAAWHLLQTSQGSLSLDIFDPLAPGEGTSGLASGLLHPYPGTRAHLHWKGERMMEEAHILLTAAALYASGPLVTASGLMRVALSSAQVSSFQEVAQKHRDCLWLKREEAEKKIPGMVLSEGSGALWVKSGLTIDMKNYLQGLMQAIVRLGARFRQERITDPSVFADYDRVVIAMGADIVVFTILADLPMTKIKGQLLEIAWPESMAPLPMSVMGESHLVMRPDRKSCLVGATFERDFQDGAPDQAIAEKELLQKTYSLFPQLKEGRVLHCFSGLRGCPTTHKPLLGRLNERFWFFTGLCAKGLLYHGYLGKKLAKALLADNPELLPKEVFHHVPLPEE